MATPTLSALPAVFPETAPTSLGIHGDTSKPMFPTVARLSFRLLTVSRSSTSAVWASESNRVLCPPTRRSSLPFTSLRHIRLLPVSTPSSFPAPLFALVCVEGDRAHLFREGQTSRSTLLSPSRLLRALADTLCDKIRPSRSGCEQELAGMDLSCSEATGLRPSERSAFLW